MLIEHVSIVNKTARNGSRTSVPAGCYRVNVRMEFPPDEYWKNNFRHEYLRSDLLKGRNYQIIHNELQLELESMDDIQAFIDEVRKTLDRMERRYGPEFAKLIPGEYGAAGFREPALYSREEQDYFWVGLDI